MTTLKYNRDNLVSLLAERATFERAAVALYDAVLEAAVDLDQPVVVSSIDTLRQHRDEEEEHAEWVEGLLEKLGGVPQHELANVADREAQILVDVVREAHASGSVLPIFYAMLSSELMDGEGWKLLLEVADEVDDPDAVLELKKRVAREDRHLELVREIILALAKESVMFAQDAEVVDDIEDFDAGGDRGHLGERARRPANIDIISAGVATGRETLEWPSSGGIRRGPRVDRGGGAERGSTMRGPGRGPGIRRGATRTRRA
jgi:rubrerythrin